MPNIYERNRNPNFWKVSPSSCNCGSFALDTAKWFTPFEFDNGDGDYTIDDRDNLFHDLMEEGHSREEVMSIVLPYDIEAILSACPWVQLTDASVLTNKRLIAYRLCLKQEDFDNGEIDEDFHFRVRIDGQWYEKCGEGDIHLCRNQNIEDIWECDNDLIYDSEIIYFCFRDE